MPTEQNKPTEKATDSVETLEPVIAVCNENESAFWRSIGLPYCDKCCSPLRSDEQGQPLCTLQLAASECPLQH
jgi:hypothetical protein